MCLLKVLMLTSMSAFSPVIAHDLLTGYIFRSSRVTLSPIMALTLQVRDLNTFIPNIYLENGVRIPKVETIVKPI